MKEENQGAEGYVQAFIRNQESEWIGFSRTQGWYWNESSSASIVQCTTKVIDICEPMHVLMDPERVYLEALMNDRLFLAWLYNKLVNEGHDPNVNYMGRLRSIIKATPADQLAPNTGSEIDYETT